MSWEGVFGIPTAGVAQTVRAAWTWLDRNVNGSVEGPSSYVTRRAVLHRESGSPCSILQTHLDNTRNHNDDPLHLVSLTL